MNNTFEVKGMRYSGPAKLVYNPSMAKMVDGITNLKPTNITKTVDNFMIKPLENGKFELYLTHSLKEENDVVIEAEIVATWEFDSIEHLRQLSDKIANSVSRQNS